MRRCVRSKKFFGRSFPVEPTSFMQRSATAGLSVDMGMLEKSLCNVE